MLDLGAAMGQDQVAVYRTASAGRRWSLVAQSPPAGQPGPGTSGLPASCDKTGIAFATARAGWITGSCNVLADAVLVSRDGGRSWRQQRLPVPPGTCQLSGCTIEPPRFLGRTGFLSVGSPQCPPYLLVSHDTGRTWSAIAQPPASPGPYQRIQFFDASHGLVIPAGQQGTIGRVLYATSDGGQSWQPLPQGKPAWRPGSTIEFVSPRSGFAWNLNASSPAIYVTADGGRAWARLRPARLVS